jgi:hypothetical protein
VLLENGTIIAVNAGEAYDQSRLKLAEPGEVSMHGQFVSTGADVFHSNTLLHLPLMFPAEEHHFNIKHSDNEYLLGYQIVPAICLHDIPVSKSKMGTSVFWMSLIRCGEIPRLIGEYYSWGRPLVARLFDGALLLGSPTGFVAKKKAGHIDTAPDVSSDSLVVSEPGIFAFEEEKVDGEKIEENQSVALVLRSFDLNGQLIAESPLLSFLGHQVNQEGSLLLASQYGVDVAVHKILDKSLNTIHEYTLNAFAFIQSGKPRKKFIAFAENLAVLAESSGSLYIYRMNKIEDNLARQYLVELGKEEVLGLTIDEAHTILALVPKKLITIKLKD